MMAHKHNVYDKDTHFQIDPITREITNESSKKVVLIQRDHNSERFTFVVPRQIEGHDMMKCNLVSVQYLNIDATDKSLQSKGVYEVDDLVENADETVTFSWLISENATMYVGTLNFCIRFECTTGSVVDYRWQTGINSKIAISSSYDNTEVITEAFPDILAQWKAEIFESGGDAVVNVNVAKEEALKEIQNASENIINSAKIVEQNAKNVLANAIKGHLKGEVVVADDVSPVEHELLIKAKGATTISRIGANFWNSDNIHSVDDNVSKNEDGSLTAKKAGITSGIQLKRVCPQLKEGLSVVLKFETTGSTRIIYLHGSSVWWSSGKRMTITQEMLDSELVFYADQDDSGNITEVILSDIIVSINETEYEPYKEVQTADVSEDGTVSGMMSTAPNMTILTDTEGVVIDCEYNVDTKLYIDKKFEELKNAILSES